MCHLVSMPSSNAVIYSCVISADSDSWTWRDWAHKIRESFPQKFYVDDDNSEKHVNRRGILKDTFGSSFGFTDFQLRPNFGITLATVRHSSLYLTLTQWTSGSRHRRTGEGLASAEGRR